MPQQIDPQALTQTIWSRFSLSEIKDLCFRLGISHEDIPGSTRRDKARELVLYCERHGRLPELAQRVAELRPKSATIESVDNAPGRNKLNKTERTAKIWVPIIVALIGLAGIIIPKLIDTETTEPTSIPSRASDTPANATDFDYAVTVRDRDTIKPISGAHVLIETGGGIAPKNGYTDSNGYVRIAIDAKLVDTKGRLSIEAIGYQRFTQEINLKLDELPAEVRLAPE